MFKDKWHTLFLRHALTYIIVENSHEIPENQLLFQLKTHIIPIEKKNSAQKCVDFSTISLIPHASKIFLKILTCRLESKSESFLRRDQYGFRISCGIRDAIAVMRVLCQRV